MIDDIESSGKELDAPGELVKLFNDFLLWEPTPPRDAKQLAHQSARLCRFLRDEVTEQLSAGNKALFSLAKSWRRMLFPDELISMYSLLAECSSSVWLNLPE